MFYKQGLLLKEEIRNGVMAVFADPVSKLQDQFKKPGWLRKIMSKPEITFRGKADK